MTEESLTPGNKLRGAHVAAEKTDPVKIWFFIFVVVDLFAVAALAYILFEKGII